MGTVSTIRFQAQDLILTQQTRWLYSPNTVVSKKYPPHAQVKTRHNIQPALLLYNSHILQVLDQQDEIERHLKTLDPSEVAYLPESVLLAPSMINAHTHLAMNCFRAFNIDEATGHNVVEDLFFHVESRMQADDVRAFATIGAYESILNGVGLVWEHYYHGQALAEGIAQTPLCAVVAPTLQDLAGPGKPHCDAQWAATESLLNQDIPGIWVALGPHATDTVSPQLWQNIAQMAQDRQLPIHVHVAQSVDEWQRAWHRHAASPVGMLNKLGVLDVDAPLAMIHGIYISEADLRLLNPKKHHLGFCPYSQLIFEYPANIFAWQNHNIPWFVATDCAASNDSMNVQKEMRYVAGMRINATTSSNAYALFQQQNTPETATASNQYRVSQYNDRAILADEHQLLSRVWDIPGAMHPSFRAGIIEKGALANFTLWDLDHPSFWPAKHPLRTLAMGDTTQAIYQMISLGQPVGTPGDFHRSIRQSAQYKAALQEADTRLQPFLQ